MRKLPSLPIFSSCVMLLGFWSALAGCSNPNYCEGHINDDCRMPMIPVAECDPSTECPGVDGKNVCDLGSQTCVQCTPDEAQACGVDAPVCRENTCGKCQLHSECADSATCLPDGKCALKADVAYVSEQGTNNIQCTKEMPCDKIAQALMRSRLYVKVTGQIDEHLILDGEKAIIFADAGARLIRSAKNGPIVEIKSTSNLSIYDLEISGPSGSNPGLLLTGSPTVSLTKIKIAGSENNGISVSGGLLTVSQSLITGNAGIGISMSGGSLTVSQSLITANTGVGVSTTGGTLALTRSVINDNRGGGISIGNNTGFNIASNFIFRNGATDGSNDFGGVKLLFAAPGTNRFEFNTIIDNHVKSGGASVGGLFCDTTDFKAANNIIARNDVAGNVNAPNANILQAGLCSTAPSVILADIEPLKLKSPDTAPYDYHLTAGSFALGKATGAASVGEDVDFDGEKRPATGRDVGADELE